MMYRKHSHTHGFLHTTSLNRHALQVLGHPVHRLRKVSGAQRYSRAGAPAVGGALVYGAWNRVREEEGQTGRDALPVTSCVLCSDNSPGLRERGEL